MIPYDPRDPDGNSSRGRLDATVEVMLRSSRADAFAPGFADRVMRRLSHAQVPVITLGRSMQRYFAWLTPPLVAAILVIAVINMRTAGQASVGAALGLPRVSVAAAYELDSTTSSGASSGGTVSGADTSDSPDSGQ